MMANKAAGAVLCILYSSGGLPDVGRHAVRAALDYAGFEGKIRVLAMDPHETLLKQTNWNCACPGGHTFTPQELERLELRQVDVTKDDLVPHLDNVKYVISALGNRQILYGDRVGAKGTERLVQAMQAQLKKQTQEGQQRPSQRLVMVTSVGCNEDWPPMEFHFIGNVLKWMFRTVMASGYRDLCGAENAVRKRKNDVDDASLDYCIVRPMGLSEERPPAGTWFVQKEKYKDKVGLDMSKMDCARFVVSEALQPTYHRTAVVVGSQWEGFSFDIPQNKDTQASEL
jgi:NAD(P)H-binding